MYRVTLSYIIPLYIHITASNTLKDAITNQIGFCTILTQTKLNFIFHWIFLQTCLESYWKFICRNQTSFFTLWCNRKIVGGRNVVLVILYKIHLVLCIRATQVFQYFWKGVWIKHYLRIKSLSQTLIPLSLQPNVVDLDF